jgi:hypothetical protein
LKPVRERTFLRLLVEAPSGDDMVPAIGAALAALGPEAAGLPWQVERLFAESAPPELGRFLAVRGEVDAYSLPSAGWDLAYRLADALGDVTVTPDLPTSIYSCPPPAIEALLPHDADLPESDPKRWSIENVRAVAAWDVSRGSGIVVGHPDTGYTIHSELGDDALDRSRDRDVIDDDDDALDPLEQGQFPEHLFPGHGTRTASVIAGRETGLIAGVAPAATVVPIRAIRTVIRIFPGDVAKAIEYARAAGCHVISMSLGGLPFRGVAAALERAVEDGLIVVAASGNYVPGGAVVWPAAYEPCIAVAATNARDRPWKYTSHGGAVAISAPGESVWVPHVHVDGDLVRSTGTSFAVPHVAGAAALWLAHHGRDALLARYKGRLQEAFRLALAQGVRSVDNWDADELGPGILDVAALLRADLPDADAVPPSPPARDPSFIDVLKALGRGLSHPRPEVVLSAHAEMLGATPDFARFGPELTYLAAENAAVRRELLGESSLETMAAAGHPPALLEAASAGLRRALELLPPPAPMIGSDPFG